MFVKAHLVPEPAPPLSITSLLDVLTILLIFLVLNFSTAQSEVNPPKDLVLPSSNATRTVQLAIKVSLSASELRVEDRVVARLVAGRFMGQDLDAAYRVTPALRELQRHKARLQSGARPARRPGGEEAEDEVVYFEAGRDLAYEVVDQVLKTAAVAGFTKFRLAVRRRE